MGRQVIVREAAEDVRDLDHGGTAGSEVGHQSIEDRSQRNAGWLGHVGVDGCGGDIGVTEQNLDDPGINIYHSPADGSHNCASGRAAAPVV